MTHHTATVSLALQRVGLCFLAVLLLMEVGCVSRRAYERIKAETQESTQALEAVREEVKELDQQIAGLQAANRREDATTGELRSAIQREEEQLPIMRQHAEAMLGSLKTQVATLMNQSWHLARKITDIRHESASLRTLAAQYKQDMETAQPPVVLASDMDKPVITQTGVDETPTPDASPTPDPTPPQVAQAAPPTPSLSPAKPSGPSPSVNVEPPTVNDSWIGIITGWLVTLWNWLFS